MVFWNAKANPEETQDVHQPSQTCGLGQVDPFNTESRQGKSVFAKNLSPSLYFGLHISEFSVAVAG